MQKYSYVVSRRLPLGIAGVAHGGWRCSCLYNNILITKQCVWPRHCYGLINYSSLFDLTTQYQIMFLIDSHIIQPMSP